MDGWMDGSMAGRYWNNGSGEGSCSLGIGDREGSNTFGIGDREGSCSFGIGDREPPRGGGGENWDI